MLNGGNWLGIFADAFNALNRSEDTNVVEAVGTTFGNSQSFSLPRRFRLGVRYNW